VALEDASRPIVAQAGGIVLREDPDAARFLIVRARRNPEHWIFPKGIVEPGETAEAAAIREVREEAGVAATPLAPLGAVEYADRARTVRVEYFLLRHQREVEADEPRETRWCRLDDALALLTFSSSRDILRAAHARASGCARA
jgi:8-oxo-dGTP pyrophosphatase MutT (NUDIX family)